MDDKILLAKCRRASDIRRMIETPGWTDNLLPELNKRLDGLRAELDQAALEPNKLMVLFNQMRTLQSIPDWIDQMLADGKSAELKLSSDGQSRNTPRWDLHEGAMDG
ncbi:MAG: hypothetical protein HQK60_19130 [Deltaproteobacteria bacterium]|nr:hypothetical protein [Deltaproteobacteria bacterium]